MPYLDRPFTFQTFLPHLWEQIFIDFNGTILEARFNKFVIDTDGNEWAEIYIDHHFKWLSTNTPWSDRWYE